jgi:hypothetical protein
MAEQDSTTKHKERGVIHWSDPQVQEVISILRMVRATGDLLTAAADSVIRGRSILHKDTLIDLGMHLEDLATNGLVILGYENPKEAPEPQAEVQGGAE